MDEPEVRYARRLGWVAVGLACIGAILNGFGPAMLPGVVGFVVPSLACQGIGLVFIQRHWRNMQEALDLEEKWRRQRERTR